MTEKRKLRNRFEIYADVLMALREPIKKTNILCKANLTHRCATSTLKQFEELGLVNYVDSKYELTCKGYEMSKKMEEIREAFDFPASQERKRGRHEA